MIGTKQQLAKANINHIFVGESEIVPVDKTKNLGVWLDSSLKMDTQITKTCCACFYQLYNIPAIRKHLSVKDTQTLVHALITSRLDYCNSLLYGIAQYQLDKYQRVQKNGFKTYL